MADAGWKISVLTDDEQRLRPLGHLGETVHNKLSGATLSARLKVWIQKNLDVKFKDFNHFLDSRIVQDMLNNDSYSFKTFIGLCVAEIQQKTQYKDWKHVSSQVNKVADILTKGAPPSMLGPESEWQQGPT